MYKMLGLTKLLAILTFTIQAIHTACLQFPYLQQQGISALKKSLSYMVKKTLNSCTTVEKQAKLEPIPPYHATKSKQKKEQDSEDCLRTHIFAFFCDYCQFFFILFFLSRCTQFVQETQISTV